MSANSDSMRSMGSSPKYDTSAMWTPTLTEPSSLTLIDNASSRSFAVGGSTVKTLSDRRSRRISYSRSGILRRVQLDVKERYLRDMNSRPWQRRKTLDGALGKFLGWEVAIFEESAGLHFGIADGTKLLYQVAEWVQAGAGFVSLGSITRIRRKENMRRKEEREGM